MGILVNTKMPPRSIDEGGRGTLGGSACDSTRCFGVHNGLKQKLKNIWIWGQLSSWRQKNVNNAPRIVQKHVFKCFSSVEWARQAPSLSDSLFIYLGLKKRGSVFLSKEAPFYFMEKWEVSILTKSWRLVYRIVPSGCQKYRKKYQFKWWYDLPDHIWRVRNASS